MYKIIETIKSINGDWQRSIFHEPVSEADIARFEKENNIKIPDSYKEFLLLSNGAELFGGDIFLYGVGDAKFPVNYDFSEGKVPKELTILGFYNSSHICYYHNSFILYEYEEVWEIERECVDFKTFHELLEYLIDIQIS